MATRKITIEQEINPIEAVFEIIGTIGGGVLAVGTGMYLNQFLPAATTVAEEALRKGTIGLGSFTVGFAGSKAIESELTDIHEAILMSKLMAAGLLSKEDVKEIEQEKEAAKTATAKK